MDLQNTHPEAVAMRQSYAPCIGLDECPPASFAPRPRDTHKRARTTRAHTRGREAGNRQIAKICRHADRTVGLPLTAGTLRAYVLHAFGPSNRRAECPAPWRISREVGAYVVARDGCVPPSMRPRMAPVAGPDLQPEALPEDWAEALAAVELADAADLAVGLA